jgi:hypothetical protein
MSMARPSDHINQRRIPPKKSHDDVNLYIESLNRQFQLALPLRDKHWSPTKSGHSQAEQCVEIIKYLTYKAPQKLDDLVVEYAARVSPSTDRLGLLHQLLNILTPGTCSGKNGAVTQNAKSPLSSFSEHRGNALSILQAVATSTEQDISAVNQAATPEIEHEELATTLESPFSDARSRNLHEHTAGLKKRGPDSEIEEAHSLKLSRYSDSRKVSDCALAFQEAALSSLTTLGTKKPVSFRSITERSYYRK